MAVEGRLDLLRLPEILQVISLQRKTGILTVQGESDIIAVSFFQGRVVAADALNEAAMEGIGGVLIEQGHVEADALHRLASRAEREGVRLLDLLIDEDHLQRSELLEALRTHTVRLLLSLLVWEEGEFKFYGGDEVSYEEGFRSIGVDELLLRAIEDEAPARARAVPSLDARLRRLESERPVVLRHARTLSGGPQVQDDGHAVWVTPDEQRVLELVSPDLTVAEIADEAGVTDERARYVLYRFAREGLVALVGAPAPAPPPPARSPPSPAAGGVGGAVREPQGRSVESVDDELTDTDGPEAERREPAVIGGRPIAIGSALLAGVLLVVTVFALPVSFFLPFPWLESERATMHDGRDAAHLFELDLAAKTFFLLQGRFPDDLAELVGAGLLERADLFDSRGRRLTYEPRERSYVVRPLVSEASRLDFEEGIAGDFLLDPEALGDRRKAKPTRPPLVLLD